MTPDPSHPLVLAALRTFPGAELRTRREALMIDPTEAEIEALMAASPVAGEYLESLGQTDLAKLTHDQWMGLLEVTVTAFQDALRPLVEARGRAINAEFEQGLQDA